MDRIYLTDLPRVLREQGIKISYHKLWRLAIEGDIPTHRDGKRMFIDAADLPKVADLLDPHICL